MRVVPARQYGSGSQTDPNDQITHLKDTCSMLVFLGILQFGDTQRHVFIEEKRNESSTHCPNPRVCDHANGPIAEEALATQPRGLVGRPAPRAT